MVLLTQSNVNNNMVGDRNGTTILMFSNYMDVVDNDDIHDVDDNGINVNNVNNNVNNININAINKRQRWY